MVPTRLLSSACDEDADDEKDEEDNHDDE